jgi:cytochrome o ubiquinol oxidase subunit 2
VLNPKGSVANQERALLFDSMALMLIVVIPVIVMSFAFAKRYHASHKRPDYRPEWSHNFILEALWWGIPTIIIVILGVILWHKTHELDPYQRLDKPGKPILVEAVALRWKWLFIYPEQGIATVNYLALPVNRQVEFYITADAPMSSFEIPQLGGQIYAMGGMRTRLHYYPTSLGTFEGLNTQMNGNGFSEMHFKAHVVTSSHFAQWVGHMQHRQATLTLAEYKHLWQPTIAAPPRFYGHVIPNLFKRIMVQYHNPALQLHQI